MREGARDGVSRAFRVSKSEIPAARNADRWADGKVFSNHAKFLMVDAKPFYVGSENLHVSDLAELGYVVDSEKAAKIAQGTFWAPLWKYSQRAAASGSEAKRCALR